MESADSKRKGSKGDDDDEKSGTGRRKQGTKRGLGMRGEGSSPRSSDGSNAQIVKAFLDAEQKKEPAPAASAAAASAVAAAEGAGGVVEGEGSNQSAQAEAAGGDIRTEVGEVAAAVASGRKRSATGPPAPMKQYVTSDSKRAYNRQNAAR